MALLHELAALLDVLGAAEEQRRALVERLGRELQDALRAVARRAARLLGDQRQRRPFVEGAELPLRALAVGRVEEDPAVEQVAVKVRDQRSHVA